MQRNEQHDKRYDNKRKFEGAKRDDAEDRHKKKPKDDAGSPKRRPPSFSSARIALLRREVTKHLNKHNIASSKQFELVFYQFIEALQKDIDAGKLELLGVVSVLFTLSALAKKAYNINGKVDSTPYKNLLLNAKTQNVISFVAAKALEDESLKASSWTLIATWCDWKVNSTNFKIMAEYKEIYNIKICNRIIELAKSKDLPDGKIDDMIKICHWLSFNDALDSREMKEVVNSVNLQLAKFPHKFKYTVYQLEQVVTYLLKLNYVDPAVSQSIINCISEKVKEPLDKLGEIFSPSICMFVGLHYQENNQDIDFIRTFSKLIERKILAPFKNINGRFFKVVSALSTFFSVINRDIIIENKVKDCIKSFIKVIEDNSTLITKLEMEYLISLSAKLVEKNKDGFYDSSIKRLEAIFSKHNQLQLNANTNNASSKNNGKEEAATATSRLNPDKSPQNYSNTPGNNEFIVIEDGQQSNQSPEKMDTEETLVKPITPASPSPLSSLNVTPVVSPVVEPLAIVVPTKPASPLQSSTLFINEVLDNQEVIEPLVRSYLKFDGFFGEEPLPNTYEEYIQFTFADDEYQKLDNEEKDVIKYNYERKKQLENDNKARVTEWLDNETLNHNLPLSLFSNYRLVNKTHQLVKEYQNKSDNINPSTHKPQ